MTRYMFGMFCKTDEYGGGDHVFQRVNDVFGERIGATERKGIVQHDRYTRKRKWCLYHRRRKKDDQSGNPTIISGLPIAKN